jgi:DNA-binding response OmpR family regulator
MYAKKILLIEDDPTLSDLLMRKLSLEGYAGYHSQDGRSGLAEAKHLKPDLILLDVIVPTMDGFQVLEALAGDPDPQVRGIPIIIISNSGQPVEIDRALRFGVKDYLVKATFDTNEVVAKIKKHLEPQVAGEGGKITSPELLVKKLLIVEDDQFLRDLAVQKFTKEHLQVSFAVDGAEGAAKAAAEHPDIILLDILLPGMDGFEVLKGIRANPELKNTLVIMLSNFGQREDMEKAKELGADSFLVKANFTLDEVVDEVKKLLGTKKI